MAILICSFTENTQNALAVDVPLIGLHMRITNLDSFMTALAL